MLAITNNYQQNPTFQQRQVVKGLGSKITQKLKDNGIKPSTAAVGGFGATGLGVAASVVAPDLVLTPAVAKFSLTGLVAFITGAMCVHGLRKEKKETQDKVDLQETTPKKPVSPLFTLWLGSALGSGILTLMSPIIQRNFKTLANQTTEISESKTINAELKKEAAQYEQQIAEGKIAIPDMIKNVEEQTRKNYDLHDKNSPAKEYHSNGQLKNVTWFSDKGVVSKEITYSKHGQMLTYYEVKWNEAGCSITNNEYYPNGIIKHEKVTKKWNSGETYVAKDVTYHKNGNKEKSYEVKDNVNRCPIVTEEYYPNGKIKYEKVTMLWFSNNKRFVAKEVNYTKNGKKINSYELNPEESGCPVVIQEYYNNSKKLKHEVQTIVRESGKRDIVKDETYHKNGKIKKAVTYGNELITTVEYNRRGKEISRKVE